MDRVRNDGILIGNPLNGFLPRIWVHNFVSSVKQPKLDKCLLQQLSKITFSLKIVKFTVYNIRIKLE